MDGNEGGARKRKEAPQKDLDGDQISIEITEEDLEAIERQKCKKG